MEQLAETIRAGELTLRRWRPAHRDELRAAVDESIESIREWMPSAASELADLDHYLGLVTRSFDEAAGFGYGIFIDAATAVGHVSLRRDGRVAEIGYWVRDGHTHRGYASSAVNALTAAAFETLPDLDRIEIHCDTANRASIRVAEKAGYIHAGNVARQPQTPTQSDTEMIWLSHRAP